MGWYAYVPTMECFHGILSMNHTLTGQLTLNKSKLNFDGGKGYRALVNVGENGGQEVPHLHFHLLVGEKVGKMVS